MRITIRASEGCIITDGENYATTFDLEENKSANDYREITLAQYEEIQKQEEQQDAEVL